MQIKTQFGSRCWLHDAYDAWSLLSLSFHGLSLAQVSLLPELRREGELLILPSCYSCIETVGGNLPVSLVLILVSSSVGC